MVVTALTGNCQEKQAPLAFPVDLSQYDFEQAIAVRGPWDFYPGLLLSQADFVAEPAPVPAARLQRMQPWHTLPGLKFGPAGFASYRTLIRLRADQELAIWFPYQMSAARLFVNGRQVAASGEIGATVEDTIPGRHDRLALIAAHDLAPVTEIVMHVANATNHMGGMRGQLVLGSEVAVRSFLGRRMMFELITLGVILGATAYHLAFFFMNPNQWAFLSFAMICLCLVLRIPLQGATFPAYLQLEIPWEIQARYLAFINAMTIPLLILLLHHLYRDLVSRTWVLIYSGISLVFALAQLGDKLFLSKWNFIYLIIMLPLIATHILIVILRASRKARGDILASIDSGSILMAFGVASGTIFSLLALHLNRQGEEGGPIAVGGYLGFVLFQSLSLSRFFAQAMRSKSVLEERVRQSEAALTQQRAELQIHLHDSLGGALTDLQIHTERRMSHDPGLSEALGSVHELITDTVQSFRSQLLFMEDLEMTAADVLPGIQMTLLRRYSDAGRELDFHVSETAQKKFTGRNPLSVGRTLDLFFLTVELCTNDLKYGEGESFWEITEEAGQLCIKQKNRLAGPTPENPWPLRAAGRAERLGGTLHVECEHGQFLVEVRIALYS